MARPDGLDPHEWEMVQAARRARSSTSDARVPVVSPDELREQMIKRLALGARTVRGHLRALREITGEPWLAEGSRGPAPVPYAGPLVNLKGTVAELRASWEAHADDMAARGLSGRVMRNHREAVLAFCEAIGVDWRPEKSKREVRSVRARGKRNDVIQLPPDFVDRVRALVNDARYVEDPLLNEVYRHSLRFAVNAFPRMPSELTRMRQADVARRADGSGAATLYQSKTGFEDGAEVVMVPRSLELAPQVLNDPTRRSVRAYQERVRPRLIARGGEAAQAHDALWVGAGGMPILPDVYRDTLREGAQEAWPGFYPYLAREIGIIVRALMLVQETGHIDVYRLAEDSGHASWDNLRRYLRAGNQILRRVRRGPELDQLLYEWRRI